MFNVPFDDGKSAMTHSSTRINKTLRIIKKECHYHYKNVKSMKCFPSVWKWIERMLDELQMFMIDSYQRRKMRKITKYAWGSKRFFKWHAQPKIHKNTSFILDKKKTFFFLNGFYIWPLVKNINLKEKEKKAHVLNQIKKIKMLKFFLNIWNL